MPGGVVPSPRPGNRSGAGIIDSMTLTVTVDDAGTFTIPREALEALGIADGGELDVEIARENGWAEVILRSHIPDEDAWLYTEEHRAAAKAAEEDLAAGRVYKMSPADLRKLADVADDDE